MSPATLAPPPPDVDAPPAPAQPEAAPPLPLRAPLRFGRAREGGLRVTRAGVAASVVLHLLIASALIVGIDEAVRHDDAIQSSRAAPERVTYVDVSQWPTSVPSGGAAAPAPGTPAAAARAVTAAAIDSAIARARDLQSFPTHVPTRLPPEPSAGARAGAPSSPAAATAGQPSGAPGGGADPNQIGGDAAGGQFGVGYRDRRLIVTPQAVPERGKTDHERYMDHLSSVLNGMNDSAAAEAEHQRRLRNWTVKDKNGREWGLGEGGVPIIAGHRIPVPLAPPIYQGRENEEAERRRATEHADIGRQAEDTERSQSVHESIRNARRHADEERRRRRGEASDSTHGGTGS